jgi:hypothetical protein
MSLIERLKSVDPELKIVEKVRLASDIGVSLNYIDDIIAEIEGELREVMEIFGIEGDIEFVGGFLTNVKPEYVERRGWTPWMGFREFIQNALDTHEFKGLGYRGGFAYVYDTGPGVLPSHALFLGASVKNICEDIGVFGEGMKMGMMALEARGISTYVLTNVGMDVILVYKWVLDRFNDSVYYLLFAIRPRKCGEFDLCSMTGTLVVSRDSYKSIEYDLRRYGVEKLELATSLNLKKITVYVPPDTPWKNKGCSNAMPESVIIDERAKELFYSRGIFVKQGSPGYTEAKLSYDLWWVELDPNRNNVMYPESVENELKRLYARLPVDDELVEVLAEIAKEHITIELVAGVVPVATIEPLIVEVAYLFMNPELLRAVLKRAFEKLGYDFESFKIYGYNMSTSTIASVAHTVAKPFINVMRTRYINSFYIEDALREIGLIEFTDAIVEEYKRMIEKVGYDPYQIPDAPLLRSILEHWTKILTGVEVRVLFGTGRSYADTQSKIVVIDSRPLEIDRPLLPRMSIDDFLATFLHELAHIYAKEEYGVYEDLTEQHVLALQKLGAKMARELGKCVNSFIDWVEADIVHVEFKLGNATLDIGSYSPTHRMFVGLLLGMENPPEPREITSDMLRGLCIYAFEAAEKLYHNLKGLVPVEKMLESVDAIITPVHVPCGNMVRDCSRMARAGILYALASESEEKLKELIKSGWSTTINMLVDEAYELAKSIEKITEQYKLQEKEFVDRIKWLKKRVEIIEEEGGG